MSRISLILSLTAVATVSSVSEAIAQASTPPAATEQTLIRGRITSGGYGAPVQRLSTVAGNTVLLSGLEGGWIINHRFVLGAAGYGLATQNVRNPSSPLRDSRGRAPIVEMGYGGVTLGWVQQPMERVHLTVQALVGGGGVTYDVGDIAGVRMEDAPNDAFFLTEPSMHAELNVTSFFRVALGAGYRFVSGAQLDGLGDADLRGASASLTLKFGRF